jgi:hypothetical protein
MKRYTGYYRRSRAATVETQHGARRSAREILPIVMDLVKPHSVVDVGAGVCTWLSVAIELGIDDVVGIDGPYVRPELLQIPREKFVPHDLTTPLTYPRTFDLAISLEVGEHLPEASSQVYVDTLTGLAPVVLFSAAIPFQPGEHHVNCQWPDYWVERFRRRGFHPVDAIRKRVWNNDAVEYWYVQNTILFVQDDHLQRSERLKQEHATTNAGQLSLVHPRRYVEFWDKSARQKLAFLLKRVLTGGWTP